MPAFYVCHQHVIIHACGIAALYALSDLGDGPLNAITNNPQSSRDQYNY